MADWPPQSCTQLWRRFIQSSSINIHTFPCLEGSAIVCKYFTHVHWHCFFMHEESQMLAALLRRKMPFRQVHALNHLANRLVRSRPTPPASFSSEAPSVVPAHSEAWGMHSTLPFWQPMQRNPSNATRAVGAPSLGRSALIRDRQ